MGPMVTERAPQGAQTFATMVQSAAKVVLCSLSDSSMKAYNKSIASFIQFIDSLPVVLKSFPADVGHIVIYSSSPS